MWVNHSTKVYIFGTRVALERNMHKSSEAMILAVMDAILALS